MSTMTQKMSEASDQSATNRAKSDPKKGDKFRCGTCGMELQITADCCCKDPQHG